MANFRAAHSLEALGRRLLAFPDDLGGRTESGVHLGLWPLVAAGVGVAGLLSVLTPKRMAGGGNQNTW